MKSRSAFIVAGMICLMLILFPFNNSFAKSKVIVLKFANFFPPPAEQSKICVEFAKELEHRTHGRVQVRYFAGGSLLQAPQIIGGVESGIADIGLSQIDYTPGRMPVMEVAELPFGYQTGWVASQVMNDFYNNFRPKGFDGVKILWMHACPPAMLITKKPVRTLEDLKGLIIRAPGTFGKIIHALGGTPAPTPMVEVYDAMAKGVIDGLFDPYETLRTFKFADVAKYVTVTWSMAPCRPFYVAMNKGAYNRLPPDIKGIFDELCGEFREKFALMWNSVDFVGKAYGKKEGVKYIELSNAESEKWKKAIQPVFENYVDSMVKKGYSEQQVEGWIKYIKKRRDYWIAKQIALHIKSVTGQPELRP